ncbi:MAG: glycosyl transferase [Deltaproteobacteria bacterium]|nr:glycosyl transferase [Deltaproteobacteria bacterium]
MADFNQEGLISTLHNLYETFDRAEYLAKLERKLESYAEEIKICLLLPSLYSEILNPDVLDPIIKQINEVKYLYKVVVALGGAPEEAQFKEAREYFYQLKCTGREVKVVWVEGPRLQAIFQDIAAREIPVGVSGKGQSVWISLGYIFARLEAEVVALHDCDIVTYDRTMLGRLIEPAANPNNDFEFCKGYYARISPSERAMKGRVTRLFVAPFVDAMKELMYTRGYTDLGRFFSYHRTFNYPLAGEFSFTTRLGRGINIAYDWGLEVSTLSEVYHRVIPRKIAQIDLAPNYEHKHQDLSPEDKSRGLHRMVVDIAKFFLFYMRAHGVALDDAQVDMIRHTYYQNSLKFVKAYSDDADVNGLNYDRYKEEMTVRHFRDFLATAWEQVQDQTEGTLIPAWNRVIYSIPDIYRKILEAVEADNC